MGGADFVAAATSHPFYRTIPLCDGKIMPSRKTVRPESKRTRHTPCAFLNSPPPQGSKGLGALRVPFLLPQPTPFQSHTTLRVPFLTPQPTPFQYHSTLRVPFLVPQPRPFQSHTTLRVPFLTPPPTYIVNNLPTSASCPSTYPDKVRTTSSLLNFFYPFMR